MHDGLPVTIYRPAIVVGDSATGCPHQFKTWRTVGDRQRVGPGHFLGGQELHIAIRIACYEGKRDTDLRGQSRLHFI